jgi:hypothetical protein
MARSNSAQDSTDLIRFFVSPKNVLSVASAASASEASSSAFLTCSRSCSVLKEICYRLLKITVGISQIFSDDQLKRWE